MCKRAGKSEAGSRACVEGDSLTWDQTLFVSALLFILQLLTVLVTIVLCVVIAAPHKNARLENWVRAKVLRRPDTDLAA